MSIIYIDSYRFAAPPSGYDPDAAAYIARVEGASGDNQALEPAVKDAINAFVVGCKADGIWPAIKASCILAGARTLNGALVPLVGTAPTNFNFVAGDYNRKTGLVGDGITKYLNSNRNNNADPQDSKHLAVYSSFLGSTDRLYLGSTDGVDGVSIIYYRASGFLLCKVANANSLFGLSDSLLMSGFTGASRGTSSSFVIRNNSSSKLIDIASIAPSANAILAFKTGALYSNARLAFYSIGEALDLALLDTRVTALINAFGAAIP